MKYHYFVSFAFPGGFGNAETCVEKPIMNIDDIGMISRSFEKDFNKTSIVILNYKLLKKSEGDLG